MQTSTSISAEQLEQTWKQAVEAQQQGNLEVANRLYQQVVRFDPANIGALNNLSLVLRKLGKNEQAMEVCKHMIKVQPNFAAAYERTGKILIDIGKYDESIDYFRRALSIERKPATLFSLSIPYYFKHDYREAEKLLKESLKLFPDNAAAHMNLALVYYDTKNLDKAEHHARESVKLDPASADAVYNLGMIVSSQRKSEQAMQNFKKSLELNPVHPMAPGFLLKEMQGNCDWQGVASLWPQVRKVTHEQIAKGIVPGWQPFADLSLNDNPEENFRLSDIHAREIERKAKLAADNLQFDFSKRKKNERKQLTIGYLSFDFREHPFAYLTRCLYFTSNKERFRIIAYATSPSDGSEVRRQYETDSDKFRDISHMSDKDAAQKIYDDGVDILLDLTGHTSGARLGISVLHPAPVQINMWGFTGTIGGNIMDYTVVDDLVVPEDQQPYYSEKLVYLPNTLQIAHNQEKISKREFTREECGLPKEGIVFCSFNPTYKFEPVMFDCWMKILKQIPGSVLWLRKPGELAIQNLRKEAQARGIDDKRLIFAERIDDRADYFKRMQLADIGLDTRIYNGGSTTIDTMWAGVPVITLLGRHYASRMSSGLVRAVGMEELITKNLQEYEKLAVNYATDADALAKLKQKLWENREKYPLYDSARFVKNIEKLYEETWKIFISGQKPQKIAVSE